VEIYDSARKHGVSDSDIEHAVAQALVVAEDDESKVLYLGPDQAGNLLEVVTVEREGGGELVIHAMPMRRSYQTMLPKAGDEDG
jgi:hypothetical protein